MAMTVVRVRKVTGFVAAVFGVVTVLAGGRVLLGADPGYLVFRPLLVYNTLMGVAYVAAGALIWRDAPGAAFVAGAVFALNLVVLLGVVVLHRSGEAVAVDSVRAMTFRTVVWLVLFLGATWTGRAEEGGHAG